MTGCPKPVLTRASAGWVISVLLPLLALIALQCARAAPPVEPIRFAHGASSTEIRGAVIRGERALYSLSARAGQHLSLRVTALESNAAVQIYVPGAKPEMRHSMLEIAGTALPGAGEGDDATRWTGRLPETGTYLLVVGPTRGNATYRLTVAIR